jgi:hypothetical protein
MAKNTVHGGPSDVAQEDPNHPAYMGENSNSWDGNRSSTSDENENSSDEKTKSDDRRPARTTESRSEVDRAENSSARSTAGNTKGSPRTK